MFFFFFDKMVACVFVDLYSAVVMRYYFISVAIHGHDLSLFIKFIYKNIPGIPAITEISHSGSLVERN